jgi:uncharacterized protein YsxB (DUF464 family)
MLGVAFRRDSRQRLSSVFAEGHAQAGIAGDDVVCAAASAILQAAELGLTRYAGLAETTERADGRMRVVIPPAERDREDVKAILATAELAIEQLAWQFPVNVRITRAQEPDDSEPDVEFLGNA